MKRFFMMIAFLSVVAVSAMVAHSHSQDGDRLKGRLLEEQNRAEELRAQAELKATLNARKAQAARAEAEVAKAHAEQAHAEEAEAHAKEAAAKRHEVEHGGAYADLERKFVELHRLIADLHRGGQPDRAAQLQKRALEIAQQLRSGKNETVSKQLDALIVRQGPGPVRRVELKKRESPERREDDAEKRSLVEQIREKAEASRRVAEVLADRQRELAKKLQREFSERSEDRESRENALPLADRIRQLRESGQAKRMLLELREHLEKEHAERRGADSHERERERDDRHAREHERERDHEREHERHWQDPEHEDHESDREHAEHGSRVHHLRQAAEHLQAAGFHEDAEQARHNAERLQQQGEEHGHAEHLERTIHEMGQHLKHVAERLERLESLFERLVQDDELEDDDKLEEIEIEEEIEFEDFGDEGDN
jgi:hypothetical protein